MKAIETFNHREERVREVQGTVPTALRRGERVADSSPSRRWTGGNSEVRVMLSWWDMIISMILSIYHQNIDIM